jgi:hypothetical protein
MICDSDNAFFVTMDEQLITPVMDCTGLPEVYLDFTHEHQPLGSQCDVDIRSSATGGLWTNIDSFTGYVADLEQYDITPYAANQPDVQVRFRYRDFGIWAWWWMVDNVKVYIPQQGEKDTIPGSYEFEFGDNGKYYRPLYIIDDDMYWDFSSGYPVYVGDPDEADMWNGECTIEMEVLDVEPEISPISAEINLDLAIRVTGEPGNDCTMTLFYDGTALGSVTIAHDGNTKVASMAATLDVLDINKYHVEVEYEGSGGGANPTWIFEGRFPDGKIKDLKHVFKDGDPVWVIGPEYLREFLVGQEIIFKADGEDPGSDDLAFFWDWGDGTQDIHIYANLDPSYYVDGMPMDAPHIFDVHPDRDPWFDYEANEDVSPEVNPIHVDDEVSHVFKEKGYFYVGLIVMDDDIRDGYPSHQIYLGGGGYDMEFVEVDLS